MKNYVLITGATSGIGYEWMLLFAKNKKNLLLVSRNRKKLLSIKKDLENRYKISVLIKDVDLSLPQSALDVIKFIKDNKIRIHILVNNAGFGLGGEFEISDIKREEEMINLNILSLTKLTYYILPQMKSGDKILNLASVASFLPGPYMSVYFATKAYVLSFSEALYFELRKKGIQVTALCPGSTKTEFASVAKLKNVSDFNNRSMSAESVALIGYEGLMKGKRVVIAGLTNRISVFILKFIPNSLIGKIIEKINNN